MKRETIFLRLAVVLMGFPVLAMYLFWVPKLANLAAVLFPDRIYLKYLVLIDLYPTALPFYFALYQAFKLLSYIDHHKAFSELSEKALRNIKICALTISGLYVVGMPLFYLMAEVDDAPGMIVIGLVMIFAATVSAAFASLLQKLVKNLNT